MKGKWIKTTLGDMARSIRGVSYRPDQLRKEYESDIITLLRATNIQNNIFVFSDLQFVPKEIVNDNQICKLFDIIMCMSNGSKKLVGKSAQFDSNPLGFTCGSFCSIIRSKDESLAKFVFVIVNSFEFKKQLDLTLSGSAINNLQNSQIDQFLFVIPEKKEDQQHIADILTSCDEVIEQTEKAIVKYLDIKAGMLQDLFTRGLDANGKLRPKPEDAPELYKDSPLGKIPKEWSIDTIGDLFDIEVGGDLRRELFSNFKTANHMYPIYSNSLENNGLYGYTTTPNYPAESITLTGRGTLGHAEHRMEPFDAIIRLVILKVKKDESVDCKFITEQVNYDQDFFIESTGVPQLTAPQSAKMRVRIPKIETEQSDIARHISAIDEKIEFEKKTLAKYRSIKLGLMKKLLTPPEGALET